MRKTTKYLLALTALTLLLVGSFVSAQDTSQVIEQVNLDEDVQPADLEVGEPAILPDSPFYFLRDWGREIRAFFTFNSVAKAELRERFANERLMELKKMVEIKRNPESLKKAAEKYRNEMEKVERYTERIRETAQENERIGTFLDKFTQHQFLHEKLLLKLQEQVPVEAFEKIKQAREEHLERFNNVMLKLEDKAKIPDRLVNNLEKLKGSKFKDFKNLEVLNEFKKRLPEDIQEKIEQKKEEIIERLRQSLEALPPEEQEQFKQYIERISGDKLNQLDILGYLEGKELSERLRTIIKQAREINVERIKNKYKEMITPEKTQEQINRAEQILEKAKSLILEKEITKEEMPAVYRLVEEAQENLEAAKKYYEEGNYGAAFGQTTTFESLSKNAIRIMAVRAGFEETAESQAIICTDIEAPVCGTDGNTYLNICEAKKQGVAIAYREVCRAEIRCAIEGQRVNRNPLLGAISQLCCEGLEEIRVARTYSICKKPGVSFQCQTDEDCPLSRCIGETSKCVEGKCIVPLCKEPQVCIQVITPAKDPITNECKEFPTPCDVPKSWTRVNSCPQLQLKLKSSLQTQEGAKE